LWHAFLFLGLTFFPSSSFCLVAYASFSIKKYVFNYVVSICMTSSPS
jgi:NADH:ubiquinone oxidoreductase subunit 6 (subunit J)